MGVQDGNGGVGGDGGAGWGCEWGWGWGCGMGVRDGGSRAQHRPEDSVSPLRPLPAPRPLRTARPGPCAPAGAARRARRWRGGGAAEPSGAERGCRGRGGRAVRSGAGRGRSSPAERSALTVGAVGAAASAALPAAVPELCPFPPLSPGRCSPLLPAGSLLPPRRPVLAAETVLRIPGGRILGGPPRGGEGGGRRRPSAPHQSPRAPGAHPAGEPRAQRVSPWGLEQRSVFIKSLLSFGRVFGNIGRVRASDVVSFVP